MATDKNTAPETVEIFIERGASNDEPNLLVGINGVNYLLPKGMTSRVPKAVADEINRSRRAQASQDQRVDKMKDAAKLPE